MKKLLVSISFALVCATLVLAQTTTGRLSGTVSSADGVLPGATVTVTDIKTGKVLNTTSGGDGVFSFPQLEFGTYTVKITVSGFKTFVANEVKIDVGREYSLNPNLEVGGIEETVTVTAGADVVTATTAQVSNTVSPQQILSLPLITRNPLSLTTLQAGVQSNAFSNTTINGMRTTFTNITRDGINIQDAFIRTNATDFAPGRPSVDDTGEFTISLSNVEADQGYGGAQIRLVTPRGTKDFHGALFAYNRNSEFAANNFFANRSGLDRPFRNRNQYGGKVSGPLPLLGFGEGTPSVYKDKAVFFFSYEGIRDPVSGRYTRTILTPSARNGAFTYTRATAGAPNQYCPSGASGSTCVIPNILSFGRTTLGTNTIPTTIDPIIQSRIISQLPTQSNFTGGDQLNTAGYTLNRSSNSTRNQYSSRIDVDLNDKNSILGIFNYNKEQNLRPDVNSAEGFSAIPIQDQLSTNKQFAAAYRTIISSNFVNEVRGGFFSSSVPFNRNTSVPDYFLSVPLVSNPELSFLDQGRDTIGYNLQDNADYVIGNHTLRFGGQIQKFKVDASNSAGTVPVVSVGTGNVTPFFSLSDFATIGGISQTQLGTANGLLGLLGGFYTNVSQSFNIVDPSTGFQAGAQELKPYRYSNNSLYVQDRWLVNKQLSLTVGLRYEIFPALTLANGVGLEPTITDPNNPAASLLNPQGTYQLLGGNAGKKGAYYKTDYNNFAPSIGAAYSFNFGSGFFKSLLGENRTIIRGGYSEAYGNDSIVTSINNAISGNQGFGRTGLQYTNLDNRLSTDPIPVVPAPGLPTLPKAYVENNGAQFGFFGTVFGVDPNIQVPKVRQYSFGIQRELFGNTALEIRYVGTSSNNLVRAADFNQIDIFNNGFLTDFLRATSNFNNTGNAFCSPTTAGCQALSIFTNQSSLAGPGRIRIGTGISTGLFNAYLNAGQPADLALLVIQRNLNNHPSVQNPTAAPFVNLVPNPSTGVADLITNEGRYNYNSLQVELRRRFAKGLYFQANYTFSKNLTNAIGESQSLFDPFLDINNKNLDYQRNETDQTHVFNFNGIYQLPFGKGRMFLNQGGIVDKIFGGFELSGLLQYTTGAPITFVDSRGTLNRGGRSARQTPFSNLTADQVRALTGVFEQNGNIYFINPSVINPNGQASAGYGSTPFDGQAFFNVEPGQTGNLPRTLIDGPNYFNINAALLKNIRFTESTRIQLRMEAFNLLNNVNFFQNTQLANINSSTFGQITSAGASRQLQFAIRFEF